MLRKIPVDMNRLIGDRALVTKSYPAKGRGTDEIVGKSYRVILTEHDYTPIYIRVEGPNQVEITGKTFVVFDDVSVSAYVNKDTGYAAFSFAATAVHLADND